MAENTRPNNLPDESSDLIFNSRPIGLDDCKTLEAAPLRAATARWDSQRAPTLGPISGPDRTAKILIPAMASQRLRRKAKQRLIGAGLL